MIFVPGNHDEFARKYIGHNFGGVYVVADQIYQTADGRKLWITHSDLFDGVVQYARWLAYLGDSAYEFTLKLNRYLNSLRARDSPVHARAAIRSRRCHDQLRFDEKLMQMK